MKEVRLTRKEMREILDLPNYTHEFYMNNKLRHAGFDTKKPIEMWDDPKTGDVVYRQED